MSTGCDRKQFPALPPDIATRPDRDALAELNAVVVRACQIDPNRRYANAGAMRADLQLLQQGKSVKRQRAFGQRWKWAKQIALATLVLALLSASAIFAFRGLNRIRPLSFNDRALHLYETAVYQLNRSELESHLLAFTNLTAAVALDSQFVDAYYK